MAKKTNYELFKSQYDFMFGIDEKARAECDKINGRGAYQDFALYKGGFTCKKANAEWLSPTGWKRLDELTTNDLMAVYHPESESIKFEKPLEVFKWNADKWYEFHTRFLHQINCPNHKMYTIKNSKPHIQSMEDFYNEHQKSLGGHRGKFITTFNKEGITTGLTENELRLLVAYQADGTLYKSEIEYNARFHFSKKRKVERLLKLLGDMPLRISTYSNGDTYIYANIPTKLIVKEFPKEWYNLNSEELKIIVDEIPFWDGSIGTHNCYYTSNKDNADFVQFAGSVAGYRSTIFARTRPSISGSGKSVTEYRVNFNTNTMPSLWNAKRKTEIKVYNAEKGDIKYCPSTSTGLWLCREFNLITVTGNSGKTFCGSLRGLLFAFQWAGCSGLVGAQSQDLLDNTTKNQYEWHLENMGLKEGQHYWWSDRKTKLTLANGSTIRFRTVSNWENFRSTEFTWIELEEASLIDEKTFKELSARLREKTKSDWVRPYKAMFLHTNPQGTRGWIYKLFTNPKTKIAGYRSITAPTTENTYLPKTYVDNLMKMYSREEVEELIMGLDVNRDNTVAFPDFSMALNVKHTEYNPNKPLILTCDFNYNPMCWYLIQQYDNQWFILKELIFNNVTTQDMCKLIEPIISEQFGTKDLIIMGDAHGADQKSSGSDYQIMSVFFGEKGYNFMFKVLKFNPFIKDRLAILRRLIKTAVGERRLFVDPECKRLLYNFDECKNNLANGGLKLPTDKEIQADDNKRYLIHPIDAISYPMYFLNKQQSLGGEEDITF